MSSFKNSSNVYLILLFQSNILAQTYVVQDLVGTGEKIASSTSDQIIKYGKFDFISLISLHHDFFMTYKA